jgi:hypothetical protein
MINISIVTLFSRQDPEDCSDWPMEDAVSLQGQHHCNKEDSEARRRSVADSLMDHRAMDATEWIS